ncbi:uncharacterized protein LOC101463350 [Ceratitis capitata]|uniref:uncharacterized protein LOC101463350 n=1 Tax=Ceratitis capitata TaxID=7213 RepID=UPI00032A1E92|nr:uncharacterized protein LOC101463350 [Ceratitis capitata]
MFVKLLTLLIVAILAAQSEAHNNNRYYVERVPLPFGTDCADSADFQLCQDFRDIRNLIDPNTLVYYISYGYYQDDDFRKAMDFIKTDRFQSVSDQIANSNGYQRLLQRFADAGVNTETIASISNIFNCLMIAIPKYSDDAEEITSLDDMQSIVVPRISLGDIASKLIKSIKRSDLRKLLREKLNENGEFANFYSVLRSRDFQHDVKRFFHEYQVKYPISVLKRHKIDLSKLFDMTVKLLDC